MPVYKQPDVYVGLKLQVEGPVIAAAVGYGCLIGVTQKGPLRVITRTRSFDAWKRIYGERETRSDMAYEAEAFFRNGGVELLTSRIAHYTDIADPDTAVGGIASRTADTDGVGPQAATKTGGVGPFNLEPGVNFNLNVDLVGVAAVTFDAAPSTKAGSGLSITDLTGLTLILSFDLGAPEGNQTVTFAAAHTADPDGAAAEINAKIQGGFAVVNAGEIDITSDTKGTNSLVNIVGGTALTQLGHSAGASAAGTGDVADIDAVTVQEVETRIENDTTAEVTVNSDGSYTVSSPTEGATSELAFTAGSPDALAALGLSVETINGTDAGATYPTLTLESGHLGLPSPGLRGNDTETKITRNPKHPSAGAGSDLAADITATDTSFQVTTLDGIGKNSVLQVTDGTNTEYVPVLDIRAEVVAGVVQFYVDIPNDYAFANGYLATATTIESMEFDVEVFVDSALVETWEQLSTYNDASNNVETVINDEASGSRFIRAIDLDPDPPGIGAATPASDADKVPLTGGTDETLGLADLDWVGDSTGGTGIYALDSDIEFMPFAFVGNNNAAPVHAALNYAKEKIFLEFIGYTTIGIDREAAIAYRKTTLGANSFYGDLYAGGFKVLDPAQQSATATRSISGVGAMMGIRARVDSLPDPNGGPWQTPGGEGIYGEVYGAVDVATAYNETDHGEMNVAGINVIRKKGRNLPVTVWGGRTLYQDPDKRWLYINVVRLFQFVQKSIADSTGWAVLRNNDYILWGKLKDRVEEFLEGLLTRRAFPARRKEDAFYVKSGVDDGVMTQADIDNGLVVSEIGMAPQKPGEFIQYWFTQIEGGGTRIEA